LFISRIFLRTTALKKAVLKKSGLTFIQNYEKKNVTIFKKSKTMLLILTIFLTSSAIVLKFITVFGMLK